MARGLGYPLPKTLVAGGRAAFVNPGDSIVGHGGIAIEEVIVPFVKFERRTRCISRYTRNVIPSLIEWGALKDSETKGCYEKSAPVIVADSDLAILMYESGLHATPEAKGAMALLLNNPAFFPFQLPGMTGDFASQRSHRIDVVRYGLDDELLKFR